MIHPDIINHLAREHQQALRQEADTQRLLDATNGRSAGLYKSLLQGLGSLLITLGLWLKGDEPQLIESQHP